MATLQKIRNRAGLLIIVIGVALLAFVIGDGLRSGSLLTQGDRTIVLKINDKKIGYELYQQRLAQMTEAAEAQGRKLSDEDRMALNNQLAQEFIQDAAIQEIAENTGLSVTPKEYLALVMGNGLEQNLTAKQFFTQIGVDPNDQTAINDFISQIDLKNIEQLPADYQPVYLKLRENWQNLSSGIINERLMEKYNSILSRSYVLNDIDKEYLSGGTLRSAAFVRTPSTIFTDSTAWATDSEAKDYYSAHPEFFRMQTPFTYVDYISIQVRPDKEDYQTAEAEMLRTKKSLEETSEPETVTRNFNESFWRDVFLTEDELSSLNLSGNLSDFIKSAEVGAVNTPILMGDSYEMVKLVDKQVAPTTLSAQVIALDSLGLEKINSIVDSINNGQVSFQEMVKRYSIDEYSRENEGYLSYTNPQTRTTDRQLTRSIVANSNLDTLFEVSHQNAFIMGEDINRMIVRVAELGEPGTLYKMAYLQIPATFSNETFQEAYTKMNNILAEGGENFDTMVELAEKEGIAVNKEVAVSAASPSIGAIPSSREVVSWALRGKKGDISEKITRCGDDYLVIARIGESIDSEFVPFEQVKEQIKNRLTAEKRGNMLADKLASKNLNSLEAYAAEMQSSIDSVSDISQIPIGQMPPQFTGMVFASNLNEISKPFRAETEVMVVKPLSETSKDPNDVERKNADLKQKQDGVAKSLGYRSFQYIMSHMEISDNRGNFF